MIIKLANQCNQCEQHRVQLAGVGVAALGGTKPSMIAKKFSYGWSPAYQDTLNLRKKYDKLLKSLPEKEQLKHMDPSVRKALRK
jgi:hypothetical protein